MTVAAPTERERTLELLRTDTLYWCAKLAYIRDKRKRIVKLEPKPGQVALEELLRRQREDALPQRAIALKARQVGVSTYVQAKLIENGTLSPNFEGVCLAHDRRTGGLLYAMGERMYQRLPADTALKPPIRHFGRARFMSWGELQPDGSYYPDSSYLVDVASETEQGRGGTINGLHASEYAFWPDQLTKLAALLASVPDEDPESFIVVESTANGNNDFKDRWDDAVSGVSGYAPYFWPWWKEATYSLEFTNEAEREKFAGEVGTGPYGEDEPELIDPGPIDFFTGEHVPLSLEQLHWRRREIAKTKLVKFKQEFPTTPDEAFQTSGRRVFDPISVAILRKRCEETDPRVPTAEHPAPWSGALEGDGTETMIGRNGPLEVPKRAVWKPSSQLGVAEAGYWKVWLKVGDDGRPIVPKDGRYVFGVDVSEGIAEGEDKDADPAYHSIQVVDHKSGDQVAEYESRIDNDLLAREVYLAALAFNGFENHDAEPWVAIEKTGFYGLPTLRRLYHDYHYMSIYFHKPHDVRSDEKRTDRLGWDTNRQTKPILIAGGEELLREQTTGIKSLRLVSQMGSYVRAEKTAKTMPDRGRFADCLMAWLIARQVALELPIKDPALFRQAGLGFRPRNSVTGY